jgi:arginine/lysine/ornithine decarboxylase
MQNTHYANVAQHIATYNCKVIVAAQNFALALATQCTYSKTVVQARKALKQALKNDCKTHFNNNAFATTQLQAAIKQHKNELHFDALHTVIAAMLQRSAAVQIAYT